jgi:hypothetical protein
VRLISLAGLIAAIAIGMAGCGSSSSSTSGTGSAQSSQPPAFNRQARARFRACMQSQGVTLPNGRPQSGQQPDAKTQKAIQACRQYLPQRGGFGGQGA